MSINTILKAYFKELADFQPTWGLGLGIRGTEGRVADYSEGRVRMHVAALKKIRRDLGSGHELNQATPENVEQVLLEKDLLLRDRDWRDWKSYQRDPTLYTGELIYGLWYLPLRVTDRALQIEGALQRLHASPRVLAAAVANLKRPPRLWTQMAIEEIRGYLAFLKDVEADLKRKAPKRRREIDAAVAVGNQVGLSLLKFYKGPLLKRSTGAFAVGRKDFQFLLRHYHLYEESPEALLAVGQEQIRQTTRQLEAQARSLSRRSDWLSLIEKLRRNHPTAPRLLKIYQQETARLRAFIRRRHIASIPSDERLQIIETPEFTRNTIPYAAYVDPAMFGPKNHGTFFVTPVTAKDAKTRREILAEHNIGAMRVTSLHEGYPGHHLQFAKQYHSRGTMMKVYNCSSFYEGWALYCEEMMYEQGYYDEATRLFQLKDKLWRACRVVVDVSMQLKKMSDAEAVNFLVKHAHLARASARADVNWYTQRPTVPQSYLTGMLRIKGIRARYFKKFPKASLQQFHDKLLQFGAIPLPLVERALFR